MSLTLLWPFSESFNRTLMFMFRWFQLLFPMGRISVMIYGVLAAIIFCGYIIYDTDNLIKRYAYDEYIWAAVALYLDVINLFLSLLTVFRASDSWNTCSRGSHMKEMCCIAWILLFLLLGCFISRILTSEECWIGSVAYVPPPHFWWFNCMLRKSLSKFSRKRRKRSCSIECNVALPFACTGHHFAYIKI